MRGAMHALSTLMLVPYFVLAAFFVLVGRAAASKGWWELFDLLASTMLWTLRLGVPVVVIGFLVLAGAGFFAGAQRVAAIVLTTLAGLVLFILLIWPRTLPDAGQILFLVPCALVFAGGLWQVLRG
jgi:hypothetical protein